MPKLSNDLQEKNADNNPLVDVTTFYDPDSNTLSYVVKDPDSASCAIIDSVLDFDYAAGEVRYKSANEIIAHVRDNNLHVELLLETHIHADHLSAAPYLQQHVGGKIAISEHVVEIQNEFGKLFNEGTHFQRDGSQFDILFSDEQEYQIGGLKGVAMSTPGHTPACITHYIGNCAFVGDTLFMPDAGTARADFPGGDARVLFNSIQRIMSLPEDSLVYICHDYQPDGRELAYVSTVAEQRERNIHVNTAVSQDQFVSLRTKRDASLSMPRLIMPSLQVNMRAGHFPEADTNGQHYLRVPISGLFGESTQKSS